MPETVHAVQGDKNSRIVHIELVAGNFEWNIPDGSTVLIKFLKSDGKAGLFDKLPDGTTAATFEPDTNKVDITLAPQMLTCAGKVETQVSFIYDESIISTFTFVVLVQAAPGASHETSTDYVNWDKMFMPQTTGARIGQYLVIEEVDEHGRAKKISSRNVFENLEEIKLSSIDGSVSLRVDSRSSDAGFHNVLLIDSDNQSVDGGTVLYGISKGTDPLDAVNKQQLDESLEKVVTEEILTEKLSDYVDNEILRNALEERTIPQTAGAKVGQYLKITKVDSLGRVVEVSPVDSPSGSGDLLGDLRMNKNSIFDLGSLEFGNEDDLATVVMQTAYPEGSNEDEEFNGVLELYTSRGDEPVVIRNVAKAKSPNEAVNKQQLDEALAVVGSPLIGSTAEITPTEVLEAVEAGRNVVLVHVDKMMGVFAFNSFVIAEEFDTIYSTNVVNWSPLTMLVGLYGTISADNWTFNTNKIINENDALKNPYALTIGNAVYDGSDPVSIPASYSKTEIDAIMGAYINDIDTLIGGDS